MVAQASACERGADSTVLARDSFLAAALRARDLNGQIPWHVRKALAQRLQIALRLRIPQLYFASLYQFRDRAAAFAVIVYAASHIWYPKLLQLTFDAGEFALKHAVHNIGSALTRILDPISARLDAASSDVGQPIVVHQCAAAGFQAGQIAQPSAEALSTTLLELSHCYAPEWYKDILRSVLRRPRPFVRLLSGEARLIDALDRLASIQPPRATRYSSYSLRLGATQARRPNPRGLADRHPGRSERPIFPPSGRGPSAAIARRVQRSRPLLRFDTDLRRALRFFPAVLDRHYLSRFALSQATEILIENPFEEAHSPRRIHSDDLTERP